MIAIIDYGAGNLKSVEKALAYLGEESVITGNAKEILAANKVILPGVGAFGDAMAHLKELGLDAVIREVADRQIPFLGICLGLQLLFESSEESPGVEGLGILKGKILRIPDKEGLKIPHIGWNSLTLESDGRLFQNLDGKMQIADGQSDNLQSLQQESVVGGQTETSCQETADGLLGTAAGSVKPKEPYVYFVHSYYLKADEPEIVKASTEYGVHIHASVEKGNVFACQFHPEKSGAVGLNILKNFCQIP